MDKELVDMKEIGRRLGLTVFSLQKRVQKNEIPHYRIGRLVRFDPKEIDAWLAEKKVRAVARPWKA